MLTVAYLANQFPSAVEPYVGEEIEQLRRQGVRVIAGSVRKARPSAEGGGNECEAEIVMQPLRAIVLIRAVWLCIRRWNVISDLIWRVIYRGHEGPLQRGKALLHTWMGACYAISLRGRGVEHIHVHHGYFGSWITMVAARFLDIGFSITLHGSDLLLHGTYLDVKLENCSFCVTVSEYNRRFILDHYAGIDAEKVIVSRLGVEVREQADRRLDRQPDHGEFSILTIGRLHRVKDHAFLVRACAQLHTRGVAFECSIAGEGPERRQLESLIRRCGLKERVTLLGHVPHEQMDSLYERADVVVLTSRSEGIPLVLMEAMARGKVVLAPAITGIPELVIRGQTGFLYEAGSMGDFVAQFLLIRSLMGSSSHPDLHRPYVLLAARRLDWVRHAAQVQVRHNFNRDKNLASFSELFIGRIARQAGNLLHENSVLQQIQLPVQWNGDVPVRTDGTDAVAGARSSVVLDG